MPDHCKLQRWPACCIVAHTCRAMLGCLVRDPLHISPLRDTAIYVGLSHPLHNQPAGMCWAAWSATRCTPRAACCTACTTRRAPRRPRDEQLRMTAVAAAGAAHVCGAGLMKGRRLLAPRCLHMQLMPLCSLRRAATHLALPVHRWVLVPWHLQSVLMCLPAGSASLARTPHVMVGQRSMQWHETASMWVMHE